MNTQRKLWYTLALAAFLLALFAFLDLPASATPPGADASVEVQTAYWEDAISARGPKVAYASFADYVADMTSQRQHEHAHTFGRALYAAEGERGLPTCDARFSYGCFHEFLGTAIADLGIDSVPELNDGCFETLTESPLSCQHGIGHGVMAYFGYDDDALRASLETCRSLPNSDPIGRCYGGVFMEYNLQTMLGSEGRVRPIAEKSGEQFPCDMLDQDFEGACYFWQPQWWGQALKIAGTSDLSEMYARMGEWCSQASQSALRPCFEGIGNNIPADASFDGALSKQLCDAATDEALHQLYCKSYAANSLFVGGAGKKGDALSVCQGLSGVYYTYCAAYARNELNIASPGELPR